MAFVNGAGNGFKMSEPKGRQFYDFTSVLPYPL